MRRILEEIHQKHNSPTKIYCDNKSTIVLNKNPTFLERSIHINIRFNKIKELIGEKEIVIEYCSTYNKLQIFL